MLPVDGVRCLLKVRAMRLSLIEEDNVSDQMVEEKINELRTNYALFAAILERIHNMDLKETTIAMWMFAIDGMESLLKISVTDSRILFVPFNLGVL